MDTIQTPSLQTRSQTHAPLFVFAPERSANPRGDAFRPGPARFSPFALDTAAFLPDLRAADRASVRAARASLATGGHFGAVALDAALDRMIDAAERGKA